MPHVHTITVRGTCTYKTSKREDSVTPGAHGLSPARPAAHAMRPAARPAGRVPERRHRSLHMLPLSIDPRMYDVLAGDQSAKEPTSVLVHLRGNVKWNWVWLSLPTPAPVGRSQWAAVSHGMHVFMTRRRWPVGLGFRSIFQYHMYTPRQSASNFTRKRHMHV